MIMKGYIQILIHPIYLCYFPKVSISFFLNDAHKKIQSRDSLSMNPKL